MWLGVLIAALLLVSTVLTGCTTSSESVAPAPNVAVGPIAASSVATAATGSAPGAPQEGIKVHGHWTIEVKNPDGSLAERRDFENALGGNGNYVLTHLLARQSSVGGWGIVLMAVNHSDDAFLHDSTPAWGYIVETTNPYNYTEFFKNLTVGLPTDGANAGKLVLSGSATAQRNGKIEVVQSATTMLSSTSPPSSSYGIVLWTLTDTTLASAVNLTTGQQVAVTVVISFN